MTSFISINQQIFRIFESEPNVGLLSKKDGYKEIDPDMLSLLTRVCLDELARVDWNSYNRQRYGGVAVAREDVIKLPALPRPPRPFRSWPEFSEFVYGGLSDIKYEPEEYKLAYRVEHTYLPDGVDINNDRVIFEQKGVLSSIEEARKYVHIAKQCGVHFIFVFQEKGIACPWLQPKKDGTVTTQEEWCRKNGFSVTFLGELTAFRKSSEYQRIIKTVGAGQGTLRQQLNRGK